jgi:uncharacterized protein (TIGR00369 family)
MWHGGLDPFRAGAGRDMGYLLRGFLHGGVIAALADNAMGLSCVASHGTAKGALTVGLSADYVATAKIGQWLKVDPRVVKVGRLLGFVDPSSRQTVRS